MGFISKLLRGIFSFVGGLFGSLAKLVGLGGKSDYFLELDEPQATEAQPATAAKPAEPTPAPAPAKPAPAPQPARPQTAAPTAAQAAPQPAASANAATANAAATNGKSEGEMTFAPNYMLSLSTNGGRRRPGPSLSPFMDMAKQVTIPASARK
ncbi:MAG: hypothetical protein ACFB8W_04745 [Elainellaceae cyanobacterium]